MKKFSLFDQCTLLRYNLTRNRADEFGHLHPYKINPSDGNGFVQFFDSADDVQNWIDQVKKIRTIQTGQVNLLDFLGEPEMPTGQNKQS